MIQAAQSAQQSYSPQIRPNLSLKNLPPRLTQYLRAVQSQTSWNSIGAAQQFYQSKPINSTDFDTKSMKVEYIAAYVPTPAEAGQLADAGAANLFIPEWQEQIRQASERNGGLGNAEDGYLAWSKKGFVRLRNLGMTPEQNRRLALLSLQLGIAVERLPSRREGDFAEIQEGGKIDLFLDDAEAQIEQFISGKSEEVHLRDGKRRYGLKLNSELGLPLSYYYKKRSGLKKLGSKVLGGIAGALLNLSGARLLVSALKKFGPTNSLLKSLPVSVLKQLDPLYALGKGLQLVAESKVKAKDYLKQYATNMVNVFAVAPTPLRPYATALQVLLSQDSEPR